MPKAMLAATPPRRTSQVVDEEGQRDLVELLDDERVGEAAREGHQVVGGDGSGDGDPHHVQPTAGATDPATPTDGPTPAGTPECRSAGLVRVRVARAWAAGRDGQLKQSPQAQELPALGLSIVKPCFSIVSAKSIVAPLEVGGAHPVDDDLDAVEVARRGHRRGCARRSRAGRSGRSSRRAGRRRAGAGRRDPPARAGS